MQECRPRTPRISMRGREAVEALATAAPRPCKLPAEWVCASPVLLTPHIPSAMFAGSCRERSLGFLLRDGRFSRDPGGVAQLGERLNGIQEVRGSIPLTSTGPAVSNCLGVDESVRRVRAHAVGRLFGGRTCGNSSVGRAQPCQGWGRGFESRFPLRSSARVAKPVDARDLKSLGIRSHAGSIPAPSIHSPG